MLLRLRSPGTCIRVHVEGAARLDHDGAHGGVVARPARVVVVVGHLVLRTCIVTAHVPTVSLSKTRLTVARVHGVLAALAEPGGHAGELVPVHHGDSLHQGALRPHLTRRRYLEM